MQNSIVERRIAEGSAAMEETRKAMAEVREKLERVGTTSPDVAVLLDIQNADLPKVRQHEAVMNGNIAELLMGLDDLTKSFTSDFNAIQNSTGMEKFIGIFARGKSESMRQERIRNSSVEDKLATLLKQSRGISGIMIEHREVLREEKVAVQKNLVETLQKREETIVALEETRKEIMALDPTIIDLEMRIASATDNVSRTQMETELAEFNNQYNELKQKENVLLTTSQTLELHAKQGQTYMTSLQDQEGTQLVLIAKLEIDTQQRLVHYNTVVKSLKTAQQQEAAHKINEIGVETDKQANAMMAGIAVAANAKMADMMEAHTDNMIEANRVASEKQKADERFMMRFSEIARKHDSALYQAE